MTKRLRIVLSVSWFLVFIGSPLYANQLSNSDTTKGYNVLGEGVPLVNAEASEVEGACISVADDFSMDIPCASFMGLNYSFTLDYYHNPADPNGLYWKMDLNNFTVIPSSYQVIAGAFYNSTDGSYVVACPEKDGEIQEDVVITVNGTQLSYGLPILYEGQELTKIPIYYSDISFSPGDSLSVAASVSGGKTPFFQDVVTVPSELSMTEPSETKFFENQEIDVSWNNTSDTMLYYLSFFDPIESVSKAYETTTLVTIAKIPKSYVEPGELMLEVHAFNGKNIDELFIDDDDDEDDILDKSYWIASTYDYKNLAIEANTESKDIDVNLSPLSEAERATVPLKLLKVDRVKIKGITFTRRIYDAQQITSPGQAQISVKLKRKHLAISAINVLDADQKQYFEWSHTRDHKSKNKTYNHSINLVPYSTVIIHTKSSDLLTLNYSY